MLKAIRTLREKTGPVQGEDADDKKRIVEIRDAALTLQRTLSYFFKTMLDHAANTAALHEDLANLYPASQAASNAVALLNSSGAVFHDTPTVVEELKRVLERPVDKLINRTKDLLALAEERIVVRAEIEHYKSKVVRLANEGLGNAQKQSKAESNQEKLLSNQKRFSELNAALGAAMASIDAEIGAATDSAIAIYAQMQANYATGLLHCFGAAVAGLPAEMRTTHAAVAAVPPQPLVAPVPAAVSVTKPAAAVVTPPSLGMSDFLGGGGAGDGGSNSSSSSSSSSGAGDGSMAAAAVTAAAGGDDNDVPVAIDDLSLGASAPVTGGALGAELPVESLSNQLSAPPVSAAATGGDGPAAPGGSFNPFA